MRRILIGLGALFALVAAVVIAVPLLLPKDAIKTKVVEQVEVATGWRLRLDGPVSLSLLPGFSLIAENIGLSGEAGADGVEFARADRIEIGLALAGLFGGDIRVTGIALDQPNILLEITKSGMTSWAPRRQLTPAQEAAEILSGGSAAPADTASPQPATAAEGPEDGGFVKSIAVDRITITNGTLVYDDRRTDQRIVVSDLMMDVTAPDLRGKVSLESSLVWQDKPVKISGSVVDPLGAAASGALPVDLTVSSGDNTVKVAGTIDGPAQKANLDVAASGPSVQGLAALFGTALTADPGDFNVSAKVIADPASVKVSSLAAKVGPVQLAGNAAADLSKETPRFSGRLQLQQGSLGDLLKLAGQDLAATGTLGADLAFTASGSTPEQIAASLDLNGSASLRDGEVTGLDLASAVGGDPAADKVSGIAVDVALQGLGKPANLSGGLNWRGDAFKISGTATPAALIAGKPAPAKVKVSGPRVTAGFDGSLSAGGQVQGAVSVETASLRNLLAWIGQPLGGGTGLEGFKASGRFSHSGKGLRFEDTVFQLDQTSGRAKGEIVFGAKPVISADLSLDELALDPYFGGGGSAAGSGKSGQGGGAAPSGAGGGWSDAPVDFSGLKAVDANFSISTKQIRWKAVQIDQSALSLTIKDGVLNASLDKLALYKGTGTGSLSLNGAAAQPQVRAKFNLSGLGAYEALRDAAGFKWLEGTAAVALDVQAAGASQRQLVSSLSGNASYSFVDGAIRGINIPKMLRSLSVETLLGWQDASSEKTDFSSLTATFAIDKGIAVNEDLSLIGPLVRMSGKGTTDMPARTLNWRVEPKIVPTLEGQAPAPRKKGEDKKLAGLGVPIVISGSWDKPQIYPDIAGILQDPQAAYQQLQSMGGELTKILKGGKPDKALTETANEVIKQVTGGKTQIDVQKVLEGDVKDEDVLKAVEEGFGLPSGLLGSFGLGKKKQPQQEQQPQPAPQQ
ncbi:AsmA family protein [Roseibium litorale]|uniref:AsmA family protein n=1 Tax=Roseibium litorale TaxID=2803841 RepID=A0ABR9CN80_9HYPH|nr:AsmA family protein [Roseibium litorale]MBD8892153.1 AsmA family protein [Roseibium litorale]